MRPIGKSALRRMNGERQREDPEEDAFYKAGAPESDRATASLLLNVEEVARLLKISSRSVNRLRSAGHLPEPVELLGSIRWRRSDIEAWVAAGCPRGENIR